MNNLHYTIRPMVLMVLMVLAVLLGIAACDQADSTRPKPAAPVQRNTLNCGTVTDYDGNEYKTVQLGSQCWMAKNLRTTHYSDGTSIPQGIDYSYTTGYWYYPDRNSDNKSTYGLLYNWPAVMRNASFSSRNPSGVQGICPTGWHVPSDAEWSELEDYVSSQSTYRCGNDKVRVAKSLASRFGWRSSDDICAVGNNPSANNASGFTAVPAGAYDYVGYYGFGDGATFWSAAQYNSNSAYNRTLSNGFFGVCSGYYPKCTGYSVRCLRD